MIIVCADLITKTKEESCGRVEGESSLLLPLLQGLLDAPDNEQTADSGTESGEDLRGGLLVEVQNVLSKLAISLKSESSDMTSERRSSLLQLVTKLQNGLAVQHSNSGERRSSTSCNNLCGGGPGRFSRRRRQNRHTVGVTSEELEDARKLIEQISLCEPLNSVVKGERALQKQNSEGSVLPNRNQNTPVKNAIAKPFGSSTSTSQSPSGTSSTVETPTEASDALDFRRSSPKPKPTEISSNFSEEIEKKSVLKTPELKLENNIQESETDDDPVTVVSINKKPELALQSNPIYSKPKTPEIEFHNRFNNNKKLKMKRANTIDIPKPMNFYESEDEYDSDGSLVDKQNARRSNYLALRGPIRVGRNSQSTNMPLFEPKTDSDRKFMAFINKHNENNTLGSIWSNQTSQQNNIAKLGNNWNNRFGNIRTAFERAGNSTPSTPSTPNSARNFWKSAENASRVSTPLKQLPKVFQPNREEKSSPWSSADETNVVTGSLKVDTKGFNSSKNYKVVPQPPPVNKFSHAPTSAFAAIPKKSLSTTPTLPLSKTQLLKPITEGIVKTDFKESDNNAPLYLYSPKPLRHSLPDTSSPSSTPWMQSSEHRVHKLATSKFENSFANPLPEPPIVKPRKISKTNPFLSPEVQSEPIDKLTAPYLVKNIDKPSSVKKLSDQFNNKNTYSTFSTVKYGNKTPTVDHLSNYQPQNYTIVYGNKTPLIQNNYQPPESDSEDYHVQYQKQPKKFHPNVQPNQKPIQKNYQNGFAHKPMYTTQPSNFTYQKPLQNYSYPSSQIQLKPTKNSLPPPPPPQPHTDSELSSSESSPIPPPQIIPTYNRQASQESVKEYEAAVTRVMKGPVSQQAVTVQQKSPKGRDQHDMEVAFNLKNILNKVTQSELTKPEPIKQLHRKSVPEIPERKFSMDSATILAQNKTMPNVQRTQSYKNQHNQHTPDFMVNGKPLSMQQTEINENGESVITSKFHIPVTLNKKQEEYSPTKQMLSKSDSWHQLVHEQQRAQQKSPTKVSPTPSMVSRSKSSHSLAVPTLQFQAAMTKDEVVHKKKTIEAYFNGKMSPQSMSKTPSDESLDKSDKTEVKQTKSTINRKKTSEKVSIHKHCGVARSRTLPNINCPNLLDESNVEESFEDLFKSNV